VPKINVINVTRHTGQGASNFSILVQHLTGGVAALRRCIGFMLRNATHGLYESAGAINSYKGLFF